MTPEKLVRNFARCVDWEQRYLYLIELGENLPSLDVAKRTKEYELQGCQSQVWLQQVLIHDGGVFRLFAHSDAAIVKGLIALTIIAYDGRTPVQIVEFDIKGWFEELELHQHITPTRSQGLSAIVAQIINTAKQAIQ
ncbi:cysteine desulfuration protein SufE [Vibrio tapetis subsp. quintayensis]|uniref:cysteine desulfuration protein SufE n=1 Tax=Vibrio tapetis TaxID=52443 RepID=UPI0025B56453|nr:cysteine desulfuration protein SufE [Vibrio tapetis]MDN3679686.1 cysteine desulfuration protein SufE [Vibrio tapetis subsp. quintayensis]